jgi:plastocyanin
MKPRSLISLAAAIVIAVTVAACGSSSGGGSSAPAAGGGASVPATSASGGGTSIPVTLKDFSISATGADSLKPGTVTFLVSNQGPSAHNLTVNGPGVADAATSTFASGDTQNLTVTLKKGTYDLFCSVPGHKAAGMDMHITVS